MGRTEPRDLYDVYCLFEWGDADVDFLASDFRTKSKHKGHDSRQLDEALTRKERTFERLWAPRLSLQVPDLPHLSQILRAVRRHLRDLDLT